MTTALAVRSLDEIADSIRSHWTATEEDRFAIGRDLAEARARFPSNQEFGAWMDYQGFPFTRQWALTLRLAAENEPRVREALTTQVVNGAKPNIKTALAAVLHPQEPEEPAEREARTGRNRITVTEARRLMRVVQGNLAMLQPDEVVPMARPVIRELAPALTAWLQIWSQTEEDA